MLLRLLLTPCSKEARASIKRSIKISYFRQWSSWKIEGLIRIQHISPCHVKSQITTARRRGEWYSTTEECSSHAIFIWFDLAVHVVSEKLLTATHTLSARNLRANSINQQSVPLLKSINNLILYMLSCPDIRVVVSIGSMIYPKSFQSSNVPTAHYNLLFRLLALIR